MQQSIRLSLAFGCIFKHCSVIQTMTRAKLLARFGTLSISTVPRHSLTFRKNTLSLPVCSKRLKQSNPTIPAKATVAAWLPALRTRYDAFMSMMKSYDAERAAVQPGAVKNARQALVAAWKPLCDLINGLAIVSPSDELETLVAEMNTRIQSKKIALKQRKSAKKAAKEVAQDVVDVEK